jgi:hypothetical protein
MSLRSLHKHQPCLKLIPIHHPYRRYHQLYWPKTFLCSFPQHYRLTFAVFPSLKRFVDLNGDFVNLKRMMLLPLFNVNVASFRDFGSSSG